MQTAREHPRQSGAIGPSDPPAESFIPQTGGPGNASFSFVSLATAASFGFGLKTILLDRDRGNDAGVSRSVPRADRTRVANHQEDAPKTAATQKEDISALPPLVIGCSSDPQALADPRSSPYAARNAASSPSSRATSRSSRKFSTSSTHASTRVRTSWATRNPSSTSSRSSLRAHTKKNGSSSRRIGASPGFWGSMYPPSPTPFSLAQTHTEARRLSGGTPSDRSS